jgi:hypothetical protein
MREHTASAMIYEPVNTLKQVADDLWIVDGPIVKMAFPLGLSAPFSTRMTVVRLHGGGLWLHSPTQLTTALKAQIDALGSVRHLVSPNFIHYASIGQWAAAYPEACAWAAPGVRERAASQGIAVEFDRDLGKSAESEWAGELDQLLFEGSSIIHEVVFFHKQTRTLILADLIENFEAQKVPALFRLMLRAAGAMHPDGKAPIDMRMSFMRGRDQARQCLRRIEAWAPERIVIAHGKWYEKNGAAELKRAFRWLD